ncbi:winged helix DNA-binding protein [Nocardia cyriacigeorgica]|uniref:Winged helix DNA-binding protein n=1 Tax=Nocardia cyriacigeorgica TaxID=135487 RepID=A0A6P1DDF6_9NOCA|nr:winged helix DNA-binding protein [Nocardia cyriacigeorgica]NEW46643.1 winged helix DNA-binding protein [Nocardia cyriacigeorgica]
MIGFRLKRLDQLIETTFDRLLGNAGLNRREWQTLNVISRRPVDEIQLTDALRPFWEANGEKVSGVVDSLSARGWINRDADGRYTLTAAGHDAHAAAATEVGSLRDLMAQDVSAEEFTQMMDVLQRMTVNLENAASTSGN